MPAQLGLMFWHYHQMSEARPDIAVAPRAAVGLARLVGLDHIDNQRVGGRVHRLPKPSPDNNDRGQRDKTDDQQNVGNRLVLLAKRIEAHGAQRSRPVLSSG